mmetsp:Transcript_18643/g.46817  ORF Transcript_18643/g.46817 Transcript_18643/m.46817 type:complete len:259 (-) Transcript_18643:1452-2228(-)
MPRRQLQQAGSTMRRTISLKTSCLPLRRRPTKVWPVAAVQRLPLADRRAHRWCGCLTFRSMFSPCSVLPATSRRLRSCWVYRWRTSAARTSLPPRRMSRRPAARSTGCSRASTSSACCHRQPMRHPPRRERQLRTRCASVVSWTRPSTSRRKRMALTRGRAWPRDHCRERSPSRHPRGEGSCQLGAQPGPVCRPWMAGMRTAAALRMAAPDLTALVLPSLQRAAHCPALTTLRVWRTWRARSRLRRRGPTRTSQSSPE